LKQHPSKETQNTLPRESTAALPYAEFVNTTKTKATQPAEQRDAGWNVEWACLKAYPRKHFDTRNKTSAGIGTTVEHPPRERIVMASIERASIS
jgi:hypothetical protein